MRTADHSALGAEEREQVVSVLRAHGILHASIFGSFARGEQLSSSDLDLLIEPSSGATLFDLARLELALEDAIGRHVDLVTLDELHPAIREQVMRERETLL